MAAQVDWMDYMARKDTGSITSDSNNDNVSNNSSSSVLRSWVTGRVGLAPMGATEGESTSIIDEIYGGGRRSYDDDDDDDEDDSRGGTMWRKSTMTMTCHSWNCKRSLGIVAIVCALMLCIGAMVKLGQIFHTTNDGSGSGSVGDTTTTTTAAEEVKVMGVQATLSPASPIAPTPSSSSNTPTGETELRATAIRETAHGLSGPTALREATPQNQAMEWLIQECQLNLDPGESIPMFVQRYAMTVLYFALRGDDFVIPDEKEGGTTGGGSFLGKDGDDGGSWMDPKRNECDNYGVVCNDDDGMIISINLASQKLQGTIPEELSLLTKLQFIDLSDNDIRGFVPPEVGELFYLETLNLAHNHLSGSIPRTVCQLTTNHVLTEFISDCKDSVNLICTCCTECTTTTTSSIEDESSSSSSTTTTTTTTTTEDGDGDQGGGDKGSGEGGVIGDKEGEEGSSTVMVESGPPDSTSSSAADGDATTTTTSSNGGSSRAEKIRNRIESIVSERSTLEQPDTSQYLAMEWIIQDDNLQLNDDDPYLMERYVMALLYYSLGGHDWSDEEDGHEWLSPDHGVCTFPAVTCDEDAMVSVISLDSNNLVGTIPMELGSLTSLTWLDLSGNHISGTIPDSLGKLSQLETLLLFDNEISGVVTQSVCDLNLQIFIVDCDLQCSCCKECGKPM